MAPHSTDNSELKIAFEKSTRELSSVRKASASMHQGIAFDAGPGVVTPLVSAWRFGGCGGGKSRTPFLNSHGENLLGA